LNGGKVVILDSYGIGIDLPATWEGRIFILPPDPDLRHLPIVHAGNFSLPTDQSSYGTEAILQMGGHGAFLALVEYGPNMLGRGDFARSSLPLPIAGKQLRPSAIHMTRSDLVGYQGLFNQSGRPFSLQLVLGTKGDFTTSLAEANEVLLSLTVSEAG
jgi:hypothetical protein